VYVIAENYPFRKYYKLCRNTILITMPTYKIDINRIIEADEVKDMMARLPNPRDRALLSFFYLTGARPCEAIDMRGQDVTITDTYVAMRIRTAKKGKAKGFDPAKRTLEFPVDAPFIDEFVSYAKTKVGEQLFWVFSPRRVRQIITKASKNSKESPPKLCPYSFRHSRMTKLCNEGASLTELMYWKGSKEAKSVSSYIANKPIGRKLTIN